MSPASQPSLWAAPDHSPWIDLSATPFPTTCGLRSSLRFKTIRILADKSSEVRAKGVEVTDIVDHSWSKSTYFKDPADLSIKYSWLVRNLTQHDARMRERLTMRRPELGFTRTS